MHQNDDAKRKYRYSPAHVARYFDEYGLREWERLTATPVDEVSLYIHTYYLQKYISTGSNVLEIGAGAGRFTQVLAGLGARLLVADISHGQLELNEQHARQYGFSGAVQTWQQVDISNMSVFAPASFDSIVAYGGPMSYVLEQRDAALDECKRVLKPGGRLLLSVMSLWGTVHRYLDSVLDIPMAVNRKILKSGDLSPETYAIRQHYMHLFRADELRHWLQDKGWEIEALSASNCITLGWEEALQGIRADDQKWAFLLQTELEVCAEEASLNMGTHLIAVARKPHADQS